MKKEATDQFLDFGSLFGFHTEKSPKAFSKQKHPQNLCRIRRWECLLFRTMYSLFISFCTRLYSTQKQSTNSIINKLISCDML
jgi:hypothetical protein